MQTIELPHRFDRFPYQLPPYRARDEGKRFFDVCAHRRSGKDLNAINFTAVQMVERVGTYFHMLPFYEQGRKAIWNGMDAGGVRFTDHFPPELVARKNEQQMRVEFVNGSAWQVVGADNVDSLLSTNPVGIVFSEWSIMNPKVWDFLRPILLQNKGWAYFIYTPRGKNHAYKMHVMAEKNPEWFSQTLTVNDTKDRQGKPIISPQDIISERLSGMHEDLIQQEYFCSFNASIQGAYYSSEIKHAREQGRLSRVPYDPNLPVETAWDLGIDDSTAIWFAQRYGKEIRLIDYEERNGEAIPFYVNLLREKGYKYGTHYFPHDIRVREMGTGRSRLEVFEELGVTNYTIVPAQEIEDGIQAVRTMFPRFWIDSEKCEFGIECISQYRKELDEDKSTLGHPLFRSRPLHDWTSHCADALRMLALGLEDSVPEYRRKPRVYTPRDPYDT